MYGLLELYSSIGSNVWRLYLAPYGLELVYISLIVAPTSSSMQYYVGLEVIAVHRCYQILGFNLI